MSLSQATGAGSKPGSAGVASASMANVQRRERLRQLAMEHIDISKDPYFMRNHLGSYECKLCLTLHTNEGSYLAHTQGKRHQQNLGRRNAFLAKESNQTIVADIKKIVPKKTIKIGRPGYKVIKQRDQQTGQLSLLFSINYPKIEQGLQPRHRFMSAFEQKIEKVDSNFQYILFAAEPYETISFKIPNMKLDKGEGKFFTHWDADKLSFTLQLFFLKEKQDTTQQQQQAAAAAESSNSSNNNNNNNNSSGGGDRSVTVEDDDEFDDYY